MKLSRLLYPFRLLWRWLRVLGAAIPEFARSECALRASALTYYTLFAIVPILALVFGLAKGFNLDEWLKLRLLEDLGGHREILNYLYGFADTTLREARGGVIAGIGFLILFWITVQMLNSIERSFNRVWRVPRGRSLFRKCTDYLALVLIVPFLMIASSSAVVLISNWLTGIMAQADPAVAGSWPIRLGEIAVQLIPCLSCWVLFTFLYAFLPNTRVRCSSALFGGVIAGSGYWLFQRGYVLLQTALARYNVIYGSFSALPLFLIWIYASWLLVLFGVVLARVHQDCDWEDCRREERALPPGRWIRLQLLLVAAAAEAFQQARGAQSCSQLAERIGISRWLARKMLAQLTAAGVLSAVETGSEKKDVCYQPALPLYDLTVTGVLYRLAGEPQSAPDGGSPAEIRLEVLLQELREKAEPVSSARPLVELMNPKQDENGDF